MLKCLYFVIRDGCSININHYLNLRDKLSKIMRLIFTLPSLFRQSSKWYLVESRADSTRMTLKRCLARLRFRLKRDGRWQRMFCDHVTNDWHGHQSLWSRTKPHFRPGEALSTQTTVKHFSGRKWTLCFISCSFDCSLHSWIDQFLVSSRKESSIWARPEIDSIQTMACQQKKWVWNVNDRHTLY